MTYNRLRVCSVLALVLFACGETDTIYFDLPKAPLPNDCVNPSVRNDLGTQNTGSKTIRIRARIAQNSLGAIALEDDLRIAGDLLVLNTRFASSNLRFVLDDVEILPRDEALYKLTTTANPLCNEPFKPLAEDSIPILYVREIALPTGTVHGMANVCGAIISADGSDSQFEAISGSFSDVEIMPRMIGYVLGLLQTNACYNIQGYEDDPNLSGDLVADTPFDPAAETHEFQCGDVTQSGKCVVLDEFACNVSCADGSTPDVQNFMSSYTGCRNRFTAGQSIYMRCAVELHHSKAKCDNVWAEDFGKWSVGSSGLPNAHIADVDGDGDADAILHDRSDFPTKWRISLSNGSKFEPETLWNTGFGDMPNDPSDMLADVNGDSKADAIVVHENSWHVALSTGSSFDTPSIWISNYPDSSMVADVNADGKADAIAFDTTQARWSVALSAGTAFAAPTAWNEGFGSTSRDQAVGDVDGDRKADAVVFSTYKTQNGGTGCKWEVARSTGSAFDGNETWHAEKCSDKHRWTLADVNGDKKLDLAVFYYDVSSWFVHVSTGANFEPPRLAFAGLGQGVRLPDFPDNAEAFVGDVNGDNKADFVAFDGFRGIWTTSLCRPEGSAN